MKLFLLQEIRVIVKEIEKIARDILIILQSIHNVVIFRNQEETSMFLAINSLSVCLPVLGRIYCIIIAYNLYYMYKICFSLVIFSNIRILCKCKRTI